MANFSRILHVKIFLIMALCAHTVVGQEKDYIKKAKEEFQKEFELQNYDSAVFYLKKALALNSNDQETHYLLGYALERAVSKDARGIVNHSWKNAKEVSEEFLEVIRIDSAYSGESVILDPYSKLTSIWGSLAFSYLYRNKKDSALIALKYGREIGGFSEPLLELVRNTLTVCSDSSVLFFTGDNYTFPVLYLQQVEKYRTDINAMDAGLLNTVWYLEYMTSANQLDLSFSIEKLDSLETQEWETKEIEIAAGPPGDVRYTPHPPLRFTLKPTVHDRYLNRSDYILLEMIAFNQFRKDIYFAYGMDPSYQLALQPYLYNAGLVDLLVPYKDERYASGSRLLQIMEKEYGYESLRNNRSIITHSMDLQTMLGLYRFIFANHIIYQITMGRVETAKEMFACSNRMLPPEALPYASKEMEEFYKKISEHFD